MKKCPCRTARPFGPSTRRGLTATELSQHGQEPAFLQRPSWMQTCLESRHFLVFICLHIFKGKPKLRTNLNVGPNLLLEWLYLFRKKGDDKKIKQPNPFSKVTDESELVFSAEEETAPVCSRELCTYFKNYLQIPRSW